MHITGRKVRLPISDDLNVLRLNLKRLKCLDLVGFAPFDVKAIGLRKEHLNVVRGKIEWWPEFYSSVLYFFDFFIEWRAIPSVSLHIRGTVDIDPYPVFINGDEFLDAWRI
ncbi:hypothetical protein D3C78_1265830 [compost metagenome]